MYHVDQDLLNRNQKERVMKVSESKPANEVCDLCGAEPPQGPGENCSYENCPYAANRGA